MKNSFVQVNQRNNIFFPKWICEVLKLRRGDEFLIDVQDGVILMIPKNESYSKSLLGLHREIWIGSENYINYERNAWINSEE